MRPIRLVYWHDGEYRLASRASAVWRQSSDETDLSDQDLRRLLWPEISETQNLLHRVAQADASATDALWERHRPALRRMIDLRLDQALSRRVDASDVVQDVLLKANQRLGEYLRNPVLPFHLWLRQIARDHVIDAHRRHRQSAKRSLDREQSFRPGAGGSAFR